MEARPARAQPRHAATRQPLVRLALLALLVCQVRRDSRAGGHPRGVRALGSGGDAPRARRLLQATAASAAKHRPRRPLPQASSQALTHMSSQGTGWDNVRSSLSKFIPNMPQPPAEVAVPTIEWKPTTVLTPTVTVYKMGEPRRSAAAGYRAAPSRSVRVHRLLCLRSSSSWGCILKSRRALPPSRRLLHPAHAVGDHASGRGRLPAADVPAAGQRPDGLVRRCARLDA